MRIITLLSDWGTEGYYVSVVKGKLYSYISKFLREENESTPKDVKIVDISHDINKFDIVQRAYILKNAYPYFEQGSIHIIGIGDIASIKHPHVIVKNKGHYFIGAYNNLFPLLFDSPPEEVWELNISQESDVHTFPSRDLFPKVAYMILQGRSLDSMAYPLVFSNEEYLPKTSIPMSNLIYSNEGILIGANIKGCVLYIDNYGNAVTNITESIFKEYASKFNTFSIKPRAASKALGEDINMINTAYDAVEEGELCAIFLDNKHLELSLNKDNIARLMGLTRLSTIAIIFSNPK